MYKILGPEGKEYGPASADQIAQWIAEGRVAGQTQAQAEGGTGWKSISELPEFAAALAAKAASGRVAPGGGPPPMPSPLASGPPPSSGLAITSLVLGVLSFVGCSIVTGIPAIITGHIAHNRARKSPGQSGGGGLAMAGLVLGYLSLLFIPILAGMLLPALAKAKGKAQQINCVNNMKQIGLAARMWANDHNEKFPPDFLSMTNELSSPKILVCPADNSKTMAMDWSQFGPGNVSYEYLRPGIDGSNAGQTVVFRCPVHGSIGLADGSVQMGRQFKRNGP